MSLVRIVVPTDTAAARRTAPRGWTTLGEPARRWQDVAWGGCRRRLVVLAGYLLLAGAGCEPRVVDDPYVAAPERPLLDAGRSSEDSGASSDLIDVPPPVSTEQRDSEIGPPCVDDAQCDDGIACTTDSCDPDLQRCRFVADSSRCQDGVYCNGEERCVPRLGCQPGEPVSCGDGDACTIDRCVEAERRCEHTLRDADGDGDPDWRCVESGGDCDDANPFVSSLQPEICGNQRDDDCDGEIDESDCEEPRFDSCAAPLVIETAGRWVLDPSTVGRDLAVECGSSNHRDFVVAVDLVEPADVILTAASANSSLAMARLDACEEATLRECQPGFIHQGLSLSRLRGHQLPPGRHWFAVFASAPGEVELDVEFTSPTPPYDNETCEQPQLLSPDVPTRVELAGAVLDLGSQCAGEVGERVFRFELDSVADVELLAFMAEGWGSPRLSLRSASCSRAEDELQCAASERGRLFARALPAGTYHVAVSATLPTSVDVVLRELPPSEPPAGDVCGTTLPSLALDRPVMVDLSGFGDDGLSACAAGSVDSVYRLSLEQRSDVLLVARSSGDDRIAVDVSGDRCGGSSLACRAARSAPVRMVMRDLAAGDYHVVVSSELAQPLQLLVVARPSVASTLVSGHEGCIDRVMIGEHGGSYLGNTSGGLRQLSAGCDIALGASDGAPEQVLGLELQERRRVLIDTQGSGYRTLLNLRRGDDCPGKEVSGGCVVSASVGQTYLDRVLDPGRYWLQVDGLAGDFGPWVLDVFLTEPP